MTKLESFYVDAAGEILDENDDPIVDAVTNELLSTRDPFWDASALLDTNSGRTPSLFTTKGGLQVVFNKTNITETELGIVAADLPVFVNAASGVVNTLPEAGDAVVDYVTGKDGFDEDNDNDFTEIRPNTLGGIFHSNLTVIDEPATRFIPEPGYLDFYNAFKARDVVLYTGNATDGMLHGFDAVTASSFCCKPPIRRAEGPISTPRRPAPRSMGTPIIRTIFPPPTLAREGLSAPKSGEAFFFKRAGVSACLEPICQATETD